MRKTTCSVMILSLCLGTYTFASQPLPDTKPRAGTAPMKPIIPMLKTPGKVVPELKPRSSSDAVVPTKNKALVDVGDLFTGCVSEYKIKEEPKVAPAFLYMTGSTKGGIGESVKAKTMKPRFDWQHVNVKLDLSQIGKTYATPLKTEKETLAQYLVERMKAAGMDTKDVTFLSADSKLFGSSSVVYFSGSDTLKFKKRKMSKKNDFDGSIDDLKEMARFTKRDLAMGEFLEQVTQHFKIDDRPVARVAKYKMIAKEISNGVLRQERVTGPSAREVADWVTAARKDAKAPEASKLSQMFPGLHIDDVAFEINKLETLYRYMDRAATGFQNTFNITAGEAVDYGFGGNVHWDPKTKLWVLIDW